MCRRKGNLLIIALNEQNTRLPLGSGCSAYAAKQFIIKLPDVSPFSKETRFLHYEASSASFQSIIESSHFIIILFKVIDHLLGSQRQNAFLQLRIICGRGKLYASDTIKRNDCLSITKLLHSVAVREDSVLQNDQILVCIKMECLRIYLLPEHALNYIRRIIAQNIHALLNSAYADFRYLCDMGQKPLPHAITVVPTFNKNATISGQ